MRFHRQSVFDLVLIAFVSGLIFFLKLGGAPLWDRDEPRNAGCAVEMMATNDWVVPVFNAELRTHKPVLLYWLMMASYSVFGVNEFGARFFSALLGIGTVLLTYGMGRRLFGREVGRWSGLILASTIMFAVASRLATPDALLIFCVTLVIALFVFFAFRVDDPCAGIASTETHSQGLFPRSHTAAICIYAAMGLGVLAKGPVGLVVPTAVIGMYLLIVRLDARTQPTTWLGRMIWTLRPFEPMHFLRTCWSMRPVTAVLSAAAIALPWYVWVTLRTDGVWTREFFWTHNVSRATATMEGHSGPPVLFYLGAILVGFFPWSILTIPTGLHCYTNAKKSDQRTQRATLLLLCWIGVFIGVFSLAQTKLPSYVTPCYPALALLAGRFVCSWHSSTSHQRGWLNVGLGNLIFAGFALLIVLPVAANRFLPGSEWLGVIGLVPLVGGVICWSQLRQERHRRATTTLAFTSVAFVVCLMAIVPSEVGRHQHYDDLLQRSAEHDGPIVAYGHLEPSWIFYGGRPIREFEVEDQEEFFSFLVSNPDAMVITTRQRIDETVGLGEGFPDHAVVHETKYFLRDRPLLLLQSSLSKTVIVAERTENVSAVAPK